jgi:hypothetical protein
MREYPIKLGSILFTIVEPHPGYEVEYNRWYERDHFYGGCMVGPGILAGRRWVATRPYKELRFPADSPVEPDPMRGSYLATYWIEASQSLEWGRWSGAEVHNLHAAGRMFEHRDHVHTKMYVYRGGVFRDAENGVPAELALDHPFKGLVVVIGESADRTEALRWYRENFLPDALKDSHAAMALQFTPIPIPDSAPADIPRAPEDANRFLHMFFLDADPLDVWDESYAAHAKELEATGLGRVLWASPFIPTIPGTDTYTDQLR